MAIVTKDTRTGEWFTGRPKKVSWERIWAFSGGPFAQEGWPKKNIHTDIDFATACGLPAKVATSATQFQGYLVQLMIDLFGIEWLSHGTMDVKFIRIVDSGDTIITKATIKSIEAKDAITRFIMDVACENQKGEKVLVGAASGCVGNAVSFAVHEYKERLANLRGVCNRLATPDDMQPEPLEYLISSELNQQFLYAEEDFNPFYIEEFSNGSPIVHPALILNWSNDTRSPSYKAPSLQSGQSMWATIHTRDETFFCNPASVGKKLKVTWNTIGSYEKRGRPYFIKETLVVDEDEVEIIKRLYYTTEISLKSKVNEQ
ncbi:MaoC family dehydratase [Chloroflexota bacterium]